MIDKKLKDKLKIKDIKKSDYFFKEKVLNKEYDNNIFNIVVEKIIVNDDNIGLVIDLEVEYKYKKYKVALLYFSDKMMYYGTIGGGTSWEEMVEHLGRRYTQFFEQMCSNIIYDSIPEDFWEIRTMYN